MAEEEDSALDLSAEPSPETAKSGRQALRLTAYSMLQAFSGKACKTLMPLFLMRRRLPKMFWSGQICFASSTANPLSLDWQFLPKALRKE